MRPCDILVSLLRTRERPSPRALGQGRAHDEPLVLPGTLLPGQIERVAARLVRRQGVSGLTECLQGPRTVFYHDRFPQVIYNHHQKKGSFSRLPEEDTIAEMKTKATEASVEAFLDTIADESRRHDCLILVEIMKQATGAEPTIWGSGMVGFGTYHYRYESGREGDWFLTGFAPRKNDLTLYIMSGFDRYDGLMGRLGKYKTGKSCLYVKRLSDIDQAVLRELIANSVAHMRRTYDTA